MSQATETPTITLPVLTDDESLIVSTAVETLRRLLGSPLGMIDEDLRAVDAALSRTVRFTRLLHHRRIAANKVSVASLTGAEYRYLTIGLGALADSLATVGRFEGASTGMWAQVVRVSAKVGGLAPA